MQWKPLSLTKYQDISGLSAAAAAGKIVNNVLEIFFAINYVILSLCVRVMILYIFLGFANQDEDIYNIADAADGCMYLRSLL